MYARRLRDVTRRSFRALLYALLPAPCLACTAPVPEPRGSLGLCPRCRRRLERWPEDERTAKPPFEPLLAGWVYRPPFDAVLAGLKFHRLEYLGHELGLELAARLRPRLVDVDVVTPVPLHWRRRLARTFDQAAAIARPLAAELGLPYRKLLRRRRATPPQSRLGRAARQQIPPGTFALRRRCRGDRVLLVDDVVTTGATLRAAAGRLLDAGARSVTALAAARTPDPARP